MNYHGHNYQDGERKTQIIYYILYINLALLAINFLVYYVGLTKLTTTFLCGEFGNIATYLCGITVNSLTSEALRWHFVPAALIQIMVGIIFIAVLIKMFGLSVLTNFYAYALALLSGVPILILSTASIENPTTSIGRSLRDDTPGYYIVVILGTPMLIASLALMVQRTVSARGQYY